MSQAATSLHVAVGFLLLAVVACPWVAGQAVVRCAFQGGQCMCSSGYQANNDTGQWRCVNVNECLETGESQRWKIRTTVKYTYKNSVTILLADEIPKEFWWRF